MPVRKGSAVWKGGLKDGSGEVKLESGAYEGPYSFSSRFEDGGGTNPEEMIAGAHAACFSMALSKALADAGHAPTAVNTEAKVHLEKGEGGFSISKIDLEVNADVPGIDDAKFQELAAATKTGCPVSKVLSAAEITLNAKLSG